MVAHTCNPSTQEVEVGPTGVENDVEAILGSEIFFFFLRMHSGVGPVGFHALLRPFPALFGELLGVLFMVFVWSSLLCLWLGQDVPSLVQLSPPMPSCPILSPAVPTSA